MQNFPFNNLYQIIEANAKALGSSTVIFEDDLKISNNQFKKYIDSIAAFLHENDIKPGDKVALVMNNSWQFVANLFAISKIGGIVVPVNNFLKEDELAHILNDAQAKLLFSSAKFSNDTKNLLNKTNINKIVWVDGLPIENEKNIAHTTALQYMEVEVPAHPSKLEDTAFIIYTSGTTGKPKGAMISFKNILSNCEASKVTLKIKHQNFRMLCYLPMFHAFTLTITVILPLYTNSSIVVIRSITGVKDFKNLLKQLLFKRCHFFTGVPDIYNAMAKAKLPWYFHWFHNVKGFVSGAAPLAEEVIKRFRNNFFRGELLQGYGISECSPVVSCNTPENNRYGSVGQPLDSYQVQIFDENMRQLPVGEIGEICVKGNCVMQGYYNRPQETLDAIVDGWFKTGDIGKIDDDNFIYILDRKKDLIIHKGMNIYPREIEEVLYTHEKVNACAVVGITDKDGIEIPIIYVELKEDQILTENEVKEHLKSHLAAFKMPRKVYFMDKLPRNTTGKILKRELRELNR